MKRINILKVNQNGNEFYFGAADARILQRLAIKGKDRRNWKVKDDNIQRALNNKRCEDIAKYVTEDQGVLPSSIVIGTVKDKVEVKEDEFGYYVEFPETDDEFKKMENAFNVIDGQHRLFSFSKVADEITYELTFSMFINPSIEKCSSIFTTTNEKQEKVAANLLMWIKSRLGLLEKKEEKYFNIVNKLNKEKIDATDNYKSPLKEKIILGDEYVTNGLKGKQLVGIFNKIGLDDILKNKPENKITKIIKVYLLAWEEAVETKITDNDKKYGAFSKIAGIRFMMNMFGTIIGVCSKHKLKFKEDVIVALLKGCAANEGIEVKDLFKTDNNCLNHQDYNPYSSESGTIKYAKAWSEKLDEYADETYGAHDPTSGV